MLSALMVYDGITAPSGGDTPVALHGPGAVISVPWCQRAPPPFPQNPIHLPYQRGTPSATNALYRRSLLLSHVQLVAVGGSCVKVHNQHMVSDHLFDSVGKNKMLLVRLDTIAINSKSVMVSETIFTVPLAKSNLVEQPDKLYLFLFFFF